MTNDHAERAEALRAEYRAAAREPLRRAHELLDRSEAIRYTDEQEARRLVQEAREIAAPLRVRRELMLAALRALRIERFLDDVEDFAKLAAGVVTLECRLCGARFDAMLGDSHPLVCDPCLAAPDYVAPSQ